MDNSFELTPSEHERVYTKIIEPASFLGTTAVEKPKIVIIAGQTGAGKSKLVQQSMREFDDGNVVNVNTDDLRSFHPSFEKIVMLDDTRSAERTHTDASAWKNRLLSRCIETRRNIVMEGVFKDGKSLVQQIELLKKSGYEVTIRFVAAHERFSIWGINRRYEKEKIVRGHGRYVPIEYHNECYQKLLDTAELVEQQKAAERVEVYDRNGERLYANELNAGNWKKAAGARNAIITERERKLSDKERTQYSESWERIFEYLEKRRASTEEIERVRKLAERLIKEA